MKIKYYVATPCGGFEMISNINPGFYLIIENKVELNREERPSFLYDGPYVTEDDAERSHNVLNYLNLLNKDNNYFIIYLDKCVQGFTGDFLKNIPPQAKRIEFPDNPKNKIDSENFLDILNKTSVILKEVIAKLTSSSDLLNVLSQDRDYRVKRAISKNENTSVESLSSFAQDENHWIRHNIAVHQNTPKDILVRLLKDEVETVRRGAFVNPNLPKEVRILHEMFKG